MLSKVGEKIKQRDGIWSRREVRGSSRQRAVAGGRGAGGGKEEAILLVPVGSWK